MPEPTDFLTISDISDESEETHVKFHVQLGYEYKNWYKNSKEEYKKVVKNITDNLPITGFCTEDFVAVFSVNGEYASYDRTSIEGYIQSIINSFVRAWFKDKNEQLNIYVSKDGVRKVYHRDGDKIKLVKVPWIFFRRKSEYIERNDSTRNPEGILAAMF